MKIRKFILLALVLFAASGAYAQILKPVKWAYAAKRTSSTEAVILIKASIDKGWHIYSQKEVDGPVKTTFTFSPAPAYTLVGKTIEPKPITKFEKTFNTNVSYFENSVIFQQKVKLKAGQATVKGKLEYMVCNDRQCLPPEEVEFSVPVKPAGK